MICCTYLQVPLKSRLPSAVLSAAMHDKPAHRTSTGSFLGTGSRLVRREAPETATVGPGINATLRPRSQYLLDARPKLQQQKGTTLLPPTRLDIDAMRGQSGKVSDIVCGNLWDSMG